MESGAKIRTRNDNLRLFAPFEVWAVLEHSTVEKVVRIDDFHDMKIFNSPKTQLKSTRKHIERPNYARNTFKHPLEAIRML